MADVNCDNCGYPISKQTIANKKVVVYFSCPKCGFKFLNPVTVGQQTEGEVKKVEYKTLVEKE